MHGYGSDNLQFNLAIVNQAERAKRFIQEMDFRLTSFHSVQAVRTSSDYARFASAHKALMSDDF